MRSVDCVIVGAGAMGSILAARLATAGIQVGLVARGRRAVQLQRDGLQVSGIECYQLDCDLITDPKALESAKLLIMAVKTYDHKAALQSVAHVKVDSVLSLCNGISKNDELTDCFGKQAVLGCMAEFSGELEQSGQVVFTRDHAFYLGELAGIKSDRSIRICEQFRGAGIETILVSNIVTVEWSKFVGWAPMMALAVISRQTTPRFLGDPAYAELALAMVRELAQLADALAVPLQDQSPIPVVELCETSNSEALAEIATISRQLAINAPDHKVSALQDLEKGRPLEIEETLGYVLNLAHDFNLQMPALDTCYRLVSGINRMRN